MQQVIFCEQCGDEVEGDSRFCMNCGAAVAPAMASTASDEPIEPTKRIPKAKPLSAQVPSGAGASVPRPRRRWKRPALILGGTLVVLLVAGVAVAKFYNPTESAVESAAADSVDKVLKTNGEDLGYSAASKSFVGAITEEGLTLRATEPKSTASVTAIHDNAAVATVEVTFQGGVEGDTPSSTIPVKERWRVGLKKNSEGAWKPKWYYTTSSSWSLPNTNSGAKADLGAARKTAEDAVKAFGTFSDADSFEAWNRAQEPFYAGDGAPQLDDLSDGPAGPPADLLYTILYNDNQPGSDSGDLSLDSLAVSDVAPEAATGVARGSSRFFTSYAQVTVNGVLEGGTFQSCSDGSTPPDSVTSEAEFVVQVARSKLSPTSKWFVARMAALDTGSDTDTTTLIPISDTVYSAYNDEWDSATAGADDILDGPAEYGRC
jgi:hypothetical protein